MRQEVLWTLLMLGLPQVAAADGATGAAVPPVLPGSELVIERAETPGKAVPPVLDLRIDDAMNAALPPILPGGALEMEHAETPGTAVASELDLRINPTQLPASPYLPDGSAAAGMTGRIPNAHALCRRPSGAVLRLRGRAPRPIGALARQHEMEEPGLTRAARTSDRASCVRGTGTLPFLT